MANNPLQRYGMIRFSDIMKEKEWLGTEAKSMSALVEQNDRLSPYVVLNSYNPPAMLSGISTKPYSVSSWYGYNHALTQDMTVLNGTITGGNMKSMLKTSSESGSGLGLYAYHYSILNGHFDICTSGNADSLSQGNTSMTVYNQFHVTERVSNLSGNYLVSVQRAFCEFNLSTINSGRLIAGGEIILNGLSNAYNGCKIVLVAYNGGSTWSTTYFETGQEISDPVSFVTGDQTFTLNAAGVALINAAIVSEDKNLRFGIVTYDYDYLKEAYIGNNLLAGDDYDLDTVGNWIGRNSTVLTVENTYTPKNKTAKVLKATRTSGQQMEFDIASSWFSSSPNVNIDYYFHGFYRFDGFPGGTFYPAEFSTYTYSHLNGKQIGAYTGGLNTNLFRQQDPDAKSTNWFTASARTRLNSPEFTNTNKLIIRVGSSSDAGACANFYMTDLRIVPILFSKTWGGKYDNPRLKYYYAGLPGSVSTGSATGITTSAATIPVTISSDGYTNIITSGICWNTTGSPTIADSKTTNGNTTVSGFNQSMSGLTLGTTYYVRSYMTTEVGTSYGSQQSFTTLGLPLVTATAASSINTTSATFNGNVTSDGGYSVTARGWYYKVGSVPSSGDSNLFATVQTGTGSMTATLGGLPKNTTYYVKAWATNSQGTALSSNYITFTTLSTLPGTTTSVATNVTASTATLNGTVTDDGGHTVTDRGFCYKIGGAPAITDNKTSATVPTGTGSMLANISGLSGSTIYYFAAYATNEDGTYLTSAYQTLTTEAAATVPTLSATTSASAITNSTAGSGGNVTADGGATITQRGICWSTSSNPTTAHSKNIASGTTGSFAAYLSGLSGSTLYYVRAYAINSVGTSYGSQISFTTESDTTVPSVTTTNPPLNVTISMASIQGTVTADGGASVTQRGVCISTSPSPTTANTKVTNGTGTGSYSVSFWGLSSATLYYARAYAINSVGTAYGNQISFSTLTPPNPPTVTTTSPATSITSDSATVEGNVSSDGGANVFAKGICYNTTGSPTNSGPKVSSGAGVGSISSNLVGLASSTLYYCRAYATNSAGTSYGSEISFTTATAQSPPSVTTGIASTGSPQWNHFHADGNNVSSDGGSTITQRGVCWSITNSNPTVADTISTVSGTTGYFDVIALLGSSYQGVIYWRAYAVNSNGTGYGSVDTFYNTPES